MRDGSPAKMHAIWGYNPHKRIVCFNFLYRIGFSRGANRFRGQDVSYQGSSFICRSCNWLGRESDHVIRALADLGRWISNSGLGAPGCARFLFWQTVPIWIHWMGPVHSLCSGRNGLGYAVAANIGLRLSLRAGFACSIVARRDVIQGCIDPLGKLLDFIIIPLTRNRTLPVR
jgi:hypothetical protein